MAPRREARKPAAAPELPTRGDVSCLSASTFGYRTAMGFRGEPVAPCSRSSAEMNANS